MIITYDSEADALYITFRQEIVGKLVTRRLDESRMVDTDDLGDRGVELLFVSRGVCLDGLPRREEIAAALSAISHAA